ncbi:helix-turn-helix domain-containing protein [Candidatus Woesearchaeota archaeon]|jgi:predicted transcriptional regulator|nr:helix-turn-helix domain-containing protein [Candidatus Woesearchaeota archaeon]MBT7237492.1 helix-turn-helix domain-containing protein [Candidatus Woesearchaeota archaeon]
MEDNTFMMVSMKDSKSVADALSNKTSQKILQYLTEKKEATESELAEKLEIPLPTIHYNIQQLKKANLIKSKEFFWSKKGRKMKIFTLAKKFIVISPDSSEDTLSKLKSLLPVTVLSFVGAGIVHLYQKSRIVTGVISKESFVETAGKVIPQADKIVEGDANVIPETISTLSQEPNLALWFLAGSLLSIVLVFTFNLMKKK